MKPDIKNIFKDFPPFLAITESVKKENASRIFTGGVRINNGHYRTQAEDAIYRLKSLQRKLP